MAAAGGPGTSGGARHAVPELVLAAGHRRSCGAARAVAASGVSVSYALAGLPVAALAT